MVPKSRLLFAAAALPFCMAFFPAGAQPPAQQDPTKPSVTGEMPPKTWVDKDTGHRVWRVSDVPNSGAFYFNVNAFTPDGRQMVYNSPAGIMVLELSTMKSKLLVPNPERAAGAPGRGFAASPHTIVVGHKTNSIFFTRFDPATRINAVYKADTNTGDIRKLIDLPPHVSIASVNADETLGAGTYNESDCPGGDPNALDAFGPPVEPGQFGGRRSAAAPQPGQPPPNANAQSAVLGGANVQAEDKGSMMERRLAARIPLVLFTIRLEPGPNGEKPGYIKQLLHSTDWVNHLLFSP